MADHKIIQQYRLLYLPNENPITVQAGPRAAFERMKQDHILDDYKVFSYLLEAQKVFGNSTWEDKLLEIINNFKPNIIFWQHVGKFPLTSNLFQKIRRSSSVPFLIYHEADVFGKFRKRLTPSMRLLTRNSDITFVVGLGENARLFESAGAKKVIHSPWCADTELFGKPWDPYTPGRKDVVMIGNHIQDRFSLLDRIPGLGFPGAKQREQFALRLYRKIGNRFTVYGSGWEKFLFSAGKLPFTDQEIVLRRHLLSVNWDHFPDTPLYFSDRLPNTLLSGVAHATNYHPGYEQIFSNGVNLTYYRSIEEAVDVIDWLLCQPEQKLIEIGLEGERFVRQNLTVDIVYRRMIETIKEDMATKIVQR